MAKKYEILEHKADLKIRAFGRSKEELFLNTMIAMIENMKPQIKKPLESLKKEIKIKSVDLTSLLVDFLSEVLYLSQTNKEVYSNVKFIKFSDTELEAEIIGQKVQRFNEDIKAVTYHDLEVKKADDQWAAVILFDI